MAGLYFEEFEVGREFHHEFSRTVTEMDNTMFSLLTMNPQPLHIDAHSPKIPNSVSGCSTASTRSVS
jgi:acyl dehydratase